MTSIARSKNIDGATATTFLEPVSGASYSSVVDTTRQDANSSGSDAYLRIAGGGCHDVPFNENVAGIEAFTPLQPRGLHSVSRLPPAVEVEFHRSLTSKGFAGCNWYTKHAIATHKKRMRSLRTRNTGGRLYPYQAVTC